MEDLDFGKNYSKKTKQTKQRGVWGLKTNAKAKDTMKQSAKARKAAEKQMKK